MSSNCRSERHLGSSPLRRFPLARILAVAATSVLSVVNISCGSKTQILPPVVPQADGMRGTVHGGQQPITDATIQLYAVGATGDGSAATPLLTSPVTTDSAGDFTITGLYTCPTSTTNVYLVSTGGNPGLAPGTNNTAASMMAALGHCGDLSSSTYVFVDEATTIGTVFPLNTFMNSYSTLGSGSGDAGTLDTDFGQVDEFVNTTTGNAPGPALPAGFDGDTTKLYTLADMMAACINTAGGVAGDSSPCGNLFLYATPPAATGLPAPTDIVGAALDIAKYPTNNIAQLFGIIPTDGPFQPILPIAPSDWNLAIEPAITLTLPSTLIGNGKTITGTINLGQAAPTGGVTVALSSSQMSFVTVSPGSVLIPAGATSAPFTYQGVASGSSVIEASATGYITATGTITSTASLISLGAGPTVAPGQSASLPLSLGVAAPSGGLTVNFTTSPGSIASISPSSVFISAGLTVPTANPQVTGVGIGTATITATATGYSPDYATATVTVSANFNPTTISVPVTLSNTTPTLNISAPAPAGGITFTLKTDNASIATVAGSVTIAAGATSAPVTVNGIGVGTTTLRADSPGITEATATVNVTTGINVGNATTGVDLETSLGISLPSSPPSPVTVNVSISGTAATISKSATTAGTTSLSFTNITSTSVGTIYVQGQSVGTGTITVTASGYGTGTGNVTVDSSGIVINPSQGTINTTTFSSPTTVTLLTALVSGTGAYLQPGGQINPGVGPFSVPVSSSSTNVGTVSSPVVFNSGDSSDTFTFTPGSTPVTPNTTTLSIVSQPAPFTTPSLYQSISANVTAPNINAGSATTGVNLETSTSISLGASPPVPTTVNVSISGTAATISKSATTVGSTSLTFTNITSTSVGTIYVQGQSVGTGTITVTASGYNNGTGNVTVVPSGFVINPNQGTINTTTFSTPTSVSLVTALLNPGTFTFSTYGGQINPGAGPFSVPVTSSLTNVGTVSSPVVFNAGDSSDTFSFTPGTTPGTPNTTTLSIGTPTPGAGFNVPSQYQSISATVTAPNINLGNATTGVNLETSIGISLGVGPPVPTTVNVSISGTSALISKTATAVGSTSLTFTNITSTSVGTIYIQGQSLGTGTITVTASGYNNGTGAVTVEPSGFVINPNQGPINTTTFSSPTPVSLVTAILNPGTFTFANYGGQINPGIGPFSVSVTSSIIATGTVTSPVVFNAGDSSDSFTFTPVAAGTTNLTLGTQPAGWSTPTQYQQITANVTAPNVNVGNATIGVSTQSAIGISLGATPPSPITVTVTSNGPAIATISKSNTVVGGTSLTFTNVTSSSVGTIYVQGQTTGSTTITVAAPGYNNGTSNITVDPTGFVINPNQGAINTTTFSSPSTVSVVPALLNPGVLTFFGYATLNPGIGPFSVPVTSMNTNAGNVTSPVVFNGGDSSDTFTFTPGITGGTTMLSLGAQPAGFSTPSQYQSLSATVTAPNINIGNTTIGALTQSSLGISLGAAPTSPITVTVTSNGPGIATISKSASVVGGTSLTFTNVTSTGVGTIYVQGQGVGSTTLTVTAPGYNNGTSNITVYPSGFVINPNQGTINTTTFSSPTTVSLVPAILNPGVLTFFGYGTLNPGIGSFNVPVMSSNTNAGTVNSPVVFNAGDSSDNFTFTPAITGGTSTLSIVSQPAGFSTPSQYQSLIANVTAPNINIGNITTGQYLQGSLGISLGATPPAPVTVTVTSSAPGVALISKSASAVGSNSLTFTNVTSTGVGTIYIQGQATGTATLTVTAAGYNNGTGTVTVNPSGFVMNPNQGNINTTTNSSSSTISLVPAILNPGILTFAGYGTLNPGLPQISVSLSSSIGSVGSITSPVIFNPGDSNNSATFKPLQGGVTILSIPSQPAGFSTPSQYQSLTATVTAPNISVSNAFTGVSLQTPISISLAAAPLTPITVTVTSNNTNVATISTSNATVGLGTLTFNNVTSTSIGTIYVQGQTLGTTSITVSAPGYNTGTGEVTVNPSGFVLNPNQGNIATTPTSSPSSVSLVPAVLNPGVLTFAGYGQLNPNIGPFNVAVTSSNTAVGTITTSPVVFHASDTNDFTSFAPANAGITTISLGAQPGGFSTPSQYQSITATVTSATNTFVGSTTTGVDLQTSVFAGLGTAPGGPISVTVTSNDPTIATVSASPTAVGTTSVTFNNVTSTGAGTVYVQGQGLGTTTLTVTAAGYTSSTGNVTVNPSGFMIYTPSFSTTTFSPPTTITIQPAILNPGILTLYNFAQLNPGIGPFGIDLGTDNSGVGTITTSPITINAGDTSESTTFHPVGPGTVHLTLGGSPFPFTTPSQQQQITATVVAPTSNIGNVTTGELMQAATSVILGTTPPGPITVTITSSDSTLATLSTSPTTVGSGMLTLTGITSSSIGSIYVQGQNKTGTATLTVSAPGYDDGTSVVTVNPSGFIISSGNIVTNPTASPSTVTVTPAILTPGLLTLYSYGQLDPGIGPYNLALTSSLMNIGTITTSPVSFSGASMAQNTGFQPVGAGTTNITLGAQPAGFSTPSQPQFTQITATVVNPDTASVGNVVTGVNLQMPVSVALGAAPASPVSVTVTVTDGTIAAISPSNGTVGSNMYTFTNVSSANVGTLYVQGLAAGSTTLTVTASGYTSGSGNVTVDPSGFVINSGNITTGLSSTPTVTIAPAILNPGVLTLYGYSQLSPGVGPISIPVTSTNTSVGNITTSPVVLNSGDFSDSTTFQPLAGGTTTLNLGAPSPATGFSTPSQYQSVTATVTGPGITIGNVVTGVKLENPLVGITLSVAPTSPVTVTVTTSGPSIASLSTSATTVGTTSITFNVAAGSTNVGTVWVQGQSLGSTTITVSAPGYSNGLGLATVDASGFVFETGNFATTHTSPGISIPIYAAVLDSTTFDFVGSGQLNPGLGTISVPIGSSSGAGSVTSPVVFNPADSSDNTTFQPLSPGTTNLTITQPSGFSAPSQPLLKQIIATVE